jgi:hypothetical protein
MYSGDESKKDDCPALYAKNELFFPDTPIIDLLQRRNEFESKMTRLFRSNRGPRIKNLLPNQESALRWLLQNNQISVLNADKNLGPVVMERDKYLHFAYKDHLQDTNTYLRLSKNEASRRLYKTSERIFNFIDIFENGSLSKNDSTYILRTTEKNLDKPSYMYLLAKINKSPLKTRAIISYSGSLCHGLATWLDVYLKKIIKHMPYVATSSKTIVEELRKQRWNSNATLFTMDAVSMYTNIHLGHALPAILSFLTDTPLGKEIMTRENLNLAQLEYALDLIMKNNIFQFGDTYWLQIAGTAMGTPPAPDYATLYFAIYEYSLIPLFPEISYYRRYIDDGFAIWLPNQLHSPAFQDQRYQEFQDATQKYGYDHEFFQDNDLRPLQWTFEKRCKKAIFLDLTITLDDDTIETTIYEKKLNLYLYLPPHSCHPPGVLKGLIFGFAYRAKSLCTNPNDRIPFLRKCYHRLLHRGHSIAKIKPIFHEAIAKVLRSAPISTTNEKIQDTLQPLFLHLKYNPFDPAPRELQDIFKDTIVSPSDRPLITDVDTLNNFDAKPDFNRMIVCYSGQRKLGTILSPRRHRFGKTFQVASHFEETYPDFPHGL